MVPVRRVLPAFLGLVLALVGAGVLTSPVLAAGDANEAGCPNEASPGFRSYLPDCRGYELVTPSYKEGVSIFGYLASAPDGSRLLSLSFGAFAGTENDYGIGTPYESSRVESGWQTTALAPPASEYPNAFLQVASSNLESGIWRGTPSASYPSADAPLYLRKSDGSLVEIGPDNPLDNNKEYFHYQGASSDLTRVVFGMQCPGQGNCGALWRGDTTISGRGSLYEYAGTGNQEPTLVGVKNAGPLKGVSYINEHAELLGQCGIELGSRTDNYNAVSTSGKTVFFTPLPAEVEVGPGNKFCREESGKGVGSGPSVSEVYARVNGSETVDISEPSAVDCELCDTSSRHSAVFQGASEDGSKVFFLSEQELLPEAKGMSLYEYNFNGAPGGRVTLVSHDPVIGNKAEVRGVVRVSEDGSHVYFVAEDRLAGSNGLGHEPVAGADNLYVFDTDTETTSFVGTLAPADHNLWSLTDFRAADTTPDGRFLVFPSSADLTPDDTSTVNQIFEYDTEKDSLTRVSIGQCPVSKATCDTSERYNNDGNIASVNYQPKIPTPVYENQFEPTMAASHNSVSNDGSYVVFQSGDGLTPLAANDQIIESSGSQGYAQNVYEYHAGNVYLISDGRDVTSEPGATSNVALHGTDSSGHDIFFTTVDPLVPQDANTGVNMYDARMGGGFPSLGTPASCAGDSCQGSLSIAPSLPSVGGSATTGGGGNLPPPVVSKAIVVTKPKIKKKSKKKTRAGKKAKRKAKARRSKHMTRTAKGGR